MPIIAPLAKVCAHHLTMQQFTGVNSHLPPTPRTAHLPTNIRLSAKKVKPNQFFTIINGLIRLLTSNDRQCHADTQFGGGRMRSENVTHLPDPPIFFLLIVKYGSNPLMTYLEASMNGWHQLQKVILSFDHVKQILSQCLHFYSQRGTWNYGPTVNQSQLHESHVMAITNTVNREYSCRSRVYGHLQRLHLEPCQLHPLFIFSHLNQKIMYMF